MNIIMNKILAGTPPANDFLTDLHNSWSMDETTSVMVDDVGSHDLTVTGSPTRTRTGVLSNAIESTGTGDYMSGGTTSTHKKFHGPTNFKFTMEFWLKFPSGAGSWDKAGMVLGTGTGSNSGGPGIHVFYDDRSSVPISRSVRLYITHDSSSYWIINSIPLDVFPDDSDWHQCVYTFDDSLSTSSAVLYVDAVNQSGATHYSGTNMSYNRVSGKTASSNNSTYKPFLLELGNGSLNGGTGMYLDMVRLWDDRIFSQTNVTDLYNGGSGLAYSSLT